MARKKPAAARPKCLCCGKPLPKHTRYVSVPSGAPAPVMLHNRPIVEVTRRKRSLLTSRSEDDLTVWLGDYGRNADNLFCGTTCGYYWARANAKRSK